MSEVSQIRVAVADDQHLFRKGLCELLNRFDGIEVILEVSNGLELINGLRELPKKPEVILLDLSMPQMNGIDAAVEIRKLFPEIRIVVLTVHNEDRFIAHLIEKGVNGYLLKTTEPEEVENAIRTVVEKDFYLNAHTIAALRGGMKQRNRSVQLGDDVDLTPREREVLELICRELTTAEIADKLFLSIRTVDGHRNNLLMKTGARNTAGLVLFAIRHNLIPPQL